MSALNAVEHGAGNWTRFVDGYEAITRLAVPPAATPPTKETAMKTCNDLAPRDSRMPDPLPSLCSLPAGHDGDHEEHLGGVIHRRWPPAATPAPGPDNCATCDGLGEVGEPPHGWWDCPTCNGSGKVRK